MKNSKHFLDLHETKITKTPRHIPEGWWWAEGKKTYFSEVKP